MKASISELTKIVIVMATIAGIFVFYKQLSQRSEKVYLKASCCIMASGNYSNGECQTDNSSYYDECTQSINTNNYNNYVPTASTFAATTSNTLGSNILDKKIAENFNSTYRIKSETSTSNTKGAIEKIITDISKLQTSKSSNKALNKTYSEVSKKTNLKLTTVNNIESWKNENSTFNATTLNNNLTNAEVTIYYDDNKATWEKSTDVQKYLMDVKNNELAGKDVQILEYNSVLKSIYEAKVTLKDDTAKQIYNNNYNKIVMLDTYTSDKITSSANGFFIKKGIVVTTWSYLKNSLKDGNKIIIKDNDSNSYIMDGVVSIQPSLNMAIIKLTEEIGSPVTIGSNKANLGDTLMSISSASNYKLTIKKGIVINNEYNYKTLIPLTNNEQGSPLFNTNGEVIGLNTNECINKSYSISTYTKYLKDLINTLDNTSFTDIKTISFNTIQSKYFYTNTKEKQVNLLNNEIWNKYKTIGNISKNIPLDIEKASYLNNILTIRYKNDIDNIEPFQDIVKHFTDSLKQSGYKNTYSYSKKLIYEKNNNKIIILNEFNYIIVIFKGK